MIFPLDRIARGLQVLFGRVAKESADDLQETHHRTQLTDVQRRISIYLHALWGSDFVIKPGEGILDKRKRSRPFVKDIFIHLPDTFYGLVLDGETRFTGLDVYRAAATHAAAHIIYSKHDFPEKLTDQWQRAVIGAIEDARVEALAIRRFPGLRQLWTVQHTASALQDQSAGDFLNRLARALLDANYQDDDPWIEQGRSLFNAAQDLDAEHFSTDIGQTLAHAFNSKNIKTNNFTDRPGAPYRDDNRYLWTPAKVLSDEDQEPAIDIPMLKLLENEKVVTDPDEDTKLPQLQLNIRSAPASDTYVYPEWDYRTAVNTPFWVTLRERPPHDGELGIIEDITTQNKHLITRMKNLLLAIQYRGVRRIRKQQEGDEIDINAAIRAMTDIRMGILPDGRIMMSSLRKMRDISVLVLLDLSSSANQGVPGQDHTVLQLTRNVCVLFAEAIEAVGDPLAIHGFNSRGRNDVDYYRLKDFDHPYNDVPKARIAGMFADRSTRMGAAIRHATHHLNEQSSGKKLLMLITDGAPSDVDAPDRHYLRHDAKHAAIDAQQSGIHTYCICLDPKADDYVSRIFGARNYMIVDHVKSLPERMLHIYAALTL
jgi:nitric oxide reductase NorD protein